VPREERHGQDVYRKPALTPCVHVWRDMQRVFTPKISIPLQLPAHSIQHDNSVSRRVSRQCIVPGSKALLSLPSHSTGHLQDVTGQRVISHKETRQMERDVARIVMAMSKLSMVITALQSTPQAMSKTSLQDIAHCSINVMHCCTLLSVTRALDI
jgi:hypothetical protein